MGRNRNSGFKLEVGAILENVVYNELLIRGYDVYVEFIIEITGIEKCDRRWVKE